MTTNATRYQPETLDTISRKADACRKEIAEFVAGLGSYVEAGHHTRIGEQIAWYGDSAMRRSHELYLLEGLTKRLADEDEQDEHGPLDCMLDWVEDELEMWSPGRSTDALHNADSNERYEALRCFRRDLKRWIQTDDCLRRERELEAAAPDLTFNIGDRALVASGLDDIRGCENDPLGAAVRIAEQGRGLEVTLRFADAKRLLSFLRGCPAAQGKSGGYAGDKGDTAAVKRLINKLVDLINATEKAGSHA